MKAVEAANLLLKCLRLAANAAILILFVVMVGSVTTQVLGRYVFGFPIAQAVEVATVAQIWMVLLAAGTAARGGMHVGVDILVKLLPQRVIYAVNVAMTLAALWFLYLIFRGSFDLIDVGMFQTTPALGVPMSYVYAAMPIGIAYFALEFVLATVNKTATVSQE